MSQRRMPSGQRPARRPSGAGRSTSRDAGGRGEPRGRASNAGRSGDSLRVTERRKPAAARRGPGTGARGSGNAKRTRAPQPRRLTGRATILFIVVVALALGYTYPIRVYLSQQTDIASIQAAQADQRDRIEQLREEAAKWQDDEYVRIQARSRLYYARPGELLLIPWWDADGAARDAGKAPAPTTPPPANPWYDTLWTSIQAANR